MNVYRQNKWALLRGRTMAPVNGNERMESDAEITVQQV